MESGQLFNRGSSLTIEELVKSIKSARIHDGGEEFGNPSRVRGEYLTVVDSHELD